MTKANWEQSSIEVVVLVEHYFMLLAQGEELKLFIVAESVVFVKGQRRDAYYRNDPSKYGLTLYSVTNLQHYL